MIDETPWDDAEFTNKVYDWEFYADTNSSVGGRIDLLTVLTHEIGHVLGLADVPAGIDPTRLMTGTLAPQVRRLPSELDLLVPTPTLPSGAEEPSPEYQAISYEDFLRRRSEPRTDDTVPVVQHEDAYDPADLAVGITNGTFAVSDENDPGFGWETRGNAYVNGGRAVLDEGGTFFSGLSQTFLIPEGGRKLRFGIPSIVLGAVAGSPPDVFEVALLNADTHESLVGVVAGLTLTDAFLNIQFNGRTYVSSAVTIAGLASSGEVLSLAGPITVEVDLTGVVAGAVATLYFDLLGFGEIDSRVVIDDIMILGSQAIPPVAQNDSAAAQAGEPVGIDVLTNDTDVDGAVDPTTVAIVGGGEPSHGTVEVDPDTGVVTYTPDAGFSGEDSFLYTVRDNDGNESNAATVSITVTAINRAPVANDDSAMTAEDAPVTIAVLSNDSDPNNDALTVSVLTDPDHGTAVVNGDGTILYTPDENYYGAGNDDGQSDQ